MATKWDRQIWNKKLKSPRFFVFSANLAKSEAYPDPLPPLPQSIARYVGRSSYGVCNRKRRTTTGTFSNQFILISYTKYFGPFLFFLALDRLLIEYKKIEFCRQHDTMKLRLIFKTFGMDLFPIIFLNFKTWFGASIPLD